MRFQFLLILFLLISCSTWKESLVQFGSKEDAIENSILDFTHSKLFNSDSVVYVIVEDTLHSIKREYEHEYSYRLVPDEPYNHLIGITIIGDHLNTYYAEEFEEEDSRVPTNYSIVDGKLFLWWDDNRELSEDVIDQLYKFNLVVSMDEAMFVTNHEKAAKYYLCRNRISRYKKVVNKSAIGSDIPKLNCP
ncbi:MAG TPA: hypothetical protein DCX27_12995 [Balneola sp.]|nr:hypothetical protein [Balneola sp.]